VSCIVKFFDDDDDDCAIQIIKRSKVICVNKKMIAFRQLRSCVAQMENYRKILLDEIVGGS
jgi:hypothetical protein